MITDMPIHPKIASGRCGVDAAVDKAGVNLSRTLLIHLYIGDARSRFWIVCSSRKCVFSWNKKGRADHLMASPLSGFRGSSQPAASWPTNQAEHDSSQGCFRLLWSKLDRKCFMEMEPRQLSKWVFFFLRFVSPFSSFLPLMFLLNSSPRAL